MNTFLAYTYFMAHIQLSYNFTLENLLPSLFLNSYTQTQLWSCLFTQAQQQAQKQAQAMLDRISTVCIHFHTNSSPLKFPSHNQTQHIRTLTLITHTFRV